MRACLGLMVVCFCGTAHAQSSETQSVVPQPPIVVDLPVDLPSGDSSASTYRGRTNYTTAGDALVWVPRVIFAPWYVVTEYGIRIPFYALTAWLDRHYVFAALSDVLHPVPDIQWSPAFTIDLGVFAAGGAAVTLSNVLAHGHTINVSAEVGGPAAWFLSARDTWRVGPLHLGARGGMFTRSDRLFFGFGPNSGSEGVNFKQTRFEGFAFANIDVQNHFYLEVAEGFRVDQTSPIGSQFTPQPGYGENDLAMAQADVRLDSRHSSAHTTPNGPPHLIHDQNTGARLVGNVTYGRDVRDSEQTFVSATADVEVAVDVSPPDRVLSLRGYLMDAVPLGSEPVPFLEQAMLGWRNHYGFVWGRFRDEAAVMLELRYRYPVAYFVDMHLIASVGNVFARDFSDFNVKKLTSSFGIGLRTRETGMTPIELVVALGSTRFDEQFGIQSGRVYLSVTEGL